MSNNFISSRGFMSRRFFPLRRLHNIQRVERRMNALINAVFMSHRGVKRLVFGSEQSPHWWSFQRHKAIFMLLLSSSKTGKKWKLHRVEWMPEISWRGFDVKINFKSLYNLLLISRVFPGFLCRHQTIHYHLWVFPSRSMTFRHRRDDLFFSCRQLVDFACAQIFLMPSVGGLASRREKTDSKQEVKS